MSTAALDLTSFEIIDRTGRDITDDVASSDFDGQAIGAAVRHAAEIGHVDLDVITERMNRDRFAQTLPGMPSTRHPGQFRKYEFADLERLVRTPRFKALARAERDEAAAREKRAARDQRDAQQRAERIEREIAAEKRAAPHLWELVMELQREIATLRGS